MRSNTVEYILNPSLLLFKDEKMSFIKNQIIVNILLFVRKFFQIQY